MTDTEQRFALSMRQADDDEPGLIRERDGTVWLVNPDGTRTQLPGSGGGSQPATGALIKLAGDTSVGADDPIPFDAVVRDTDDYYDLLGEKFVIPSGKAGLYLYGAAIVTAHTAGLTGLTAAISVSSAGPNLTLGGALFPEGFPGPRCIAVGSQPDFFDEGDEIEVPNIEVGGLASVTIVGSSTFFLTYLGALA